MEALLLRATVVRTGVVVVVYAIFTVCIADPDGIPEYQILLVTGNGATKLVVVVLQVL
jgi:hypothetical protein